MKEFESSKKLCYSMVVNNEDVNRRKVNTSLFYFNSTAIRFGDSNACSRLSVIRAA